LASAAYAPVRLAVCAARQSMRIEDAQLAAAYLDQPLVLQSSERTAHGFQHHAQIAGDVLPAHRQGDAVGIKTEQAVALAQTVQEQRHSTIGLASDQQLKMRLVLVTAATHDPQQLPLQPWKLRQQLLQLAHRQLADRRRLQ